MQIPKTYRVDLCWCVVFVARSIDRVLMLLHQHLPRNCKDVLLGFWEVRKAESKTQRESIQQPFGGDFFLPVWLRNGSLSIGLIARLCGSALAHLEERKVSCGGLLECRDPPGGKRRRTRDSVQEEGSSSKIPLFMCLPKVFMVVIRQT